MKLAVTIKGIIDIEPQDVDKIRFAFMSGPEEVVKNNFIEMTDKVANALEFDPKDTTISLDIVEDDDE